MSWIGELTQSVTRFIHQPLGEVRQSRRSLRYAVDLARYCWREMEKNRAGQAAAALTYHTLFSLIPTVVMAFLVFKAMQGLETEMKMLQDTILSWLVPPDAPGSPEAVAEAQQSVSDQLEVYTQSLLEMDLRGLGVMGVLVFLWGALGLLITIERTFNRIYDSDRPRAWYIRVPLYYTIVTLGPLMLVFGNVMRNRFIDAITHGDWWMSWLAGPMVVLSPLLTSWLVFFAIFVLMPNTHVKLRPAAIGSFTSAVCFIVGQAAFSIYVARAAMSTLYGAFALLPLFLLWIWLVWLIILFGLEVAYTLQTLHGKRMQEEEARREARVVGDPQWLLPILTRIAQAFDRGQTVSQRELAETLRLPMRSVHRLTTMLREQGMINCLDEEEAQDCRFALALPPEKVPVARLVDMMHDMTTTAGADGKDPGWQLLERFTQAQKDAAENMTLRSLIND